MAFIEGYPQVRGGLYRGVSSRWGVAFIEGCPHVGGDLYEGLHYIGGSGHLNLGKISRVLCQIVLCTEIPTLTRTIPFVRAVRTVREAITPVSDRAGTCWYPADTGVAKTTSYKMTSYKITSGRRLLW